MQNISSDTTSSHSDNQSFKVVQLRKTRRHQRWAALKNLKLPNFDSDSSHTSDSGNTNFLPSLLPFTCIKSENLS